MARKPVQMPNFASEADEAEWWNSPAGVRYAEQTSEITRAAGVFLRPAAPVTIQDIERLQEAARLLQLRPISIRFPEQDIADAKAIADAEGIGYQLVLKQAARAGLDAMLQQQKFLARKPVRRVQTGGGKSVTRRVK